MVPLQFVGVPGGIELLVIGLILLLLFGIPLAIAVVVGVLWLRSKRGDDGVTQERVEELEREVEALREQLDTGGDASGGDVTGSDVIDEDAGREKE